MLRCRRNRTVFAEGADDAHAPACSGCAGGTQRKLYFLSILHILLEGKADVRSVRAGPSTGLSFCIVTARMLVVQKTCYGESRRNVHWYPAQKSAMMRPEQPLSGKPFSEVTTMKKEEQNKILALTQQGLVRYWQGGYEEILSYFADEGTWIGAQGEQFCRGKEAIGRLLRQVAAEMVPCTLLHQEYQVVHSDRASCTVMGRYLATTCGQDGTFLQTWQRVTLLEGETLIVRGKLADLQERSEGVLMAIHRSYLVNPLCISSLEKQTAVLRSGARLPIPEKRYTMVREEIKEFFRRDGSREKNWKKCKKIRFLYPEKGH